jgi:hypothetical protein
VIAWALAVFMLGSLFGAGLGYYSAERDRERRERMAYRRLKDLQR